MAFLTNNEADIYRDKDIHLAIQHCFVSLSEGLNANEIVGSLYSSDVLTIKEKQHIDRQGDNKGSIHQAEKLLEYLLEKKTPGCLVTFLDCLKENQIDAYNLMTSTVDKIKSGEIITKTERRLKCDLCKDENKTAESKCKDCQENLCADCELAHKRSSASRNHKILTQTEIISTLQNEAKTIVHDIEEKVTFLEEQSTSIEKSIANIDLSRDEQITHVNKCISDMIQILDKHRESVIKTISEANESATNKLTKTQKLVNKEREKLQSQLEVMTEIETSNDALDLSDTNKSVKTWLKDNSHSMAFEEIQSNISSESPVMLLEGGKFDPDVYIGIKVKDTTQETCCNQYDKDYVVSQVSAANVSQNNPITTYNSSQNNTITTDHTSQSNLVTAANSSQNNLVIKETMLKEQKVVKEASILLQFPSTVDSRNKKDVKLAGGMVNIDSCEMNTSDSSSSSIVSRSIKPKFKHRKLVTSKFESEKCKEMEVDVCNIILVSDELWCCTYRNGIYVYDHNCQYIRKISGCYVDNVKGITHTDNNDLVIACDYGLCQHSLQGEFMNIIADGCYSSVSFYNNRIYATENKTFISTGNIVVFEQANHVWVRENKFPLYDYFHRSNTIAVFHGAIFVTFDKDNLIYQYNHYGEEVKRIGRYGSVLSGKLSSPRLCDVDEHGDVIVIDQGNKKLHLYDSNLEKLQSIVTTPNNLGNPTTAVIDPHSDSIWICTDDRKLMKYKKRLA